MGIWNKRIDELKKKLGLSSDTQIASLFGISRQALQQIRTGKKNPSVTTKLLIMHNMGATDIKEVMLEVLPESKLHLVISEPNTSEATQKATSTSQTSLTDRILELEHALSQVVTLAERKSERFGDERIDIAMRAKENL